MEFLKQRWAKLAPRTRQIVVVGTVGACVIFMLYLFVSANPEMTRPQKKQTIVKDILTGADVRQLGIGGLDNRTRKLEQTVTGLNKEISKLQAQLEEAKQSKLTKGDLEQQLRVLRSDLQQQIKEGEATASKARVKGGSGAAWQPDQAARAEIWQQPSDVASTDATSSNGSASQQAPTSSKIRVIGDEPDNAGTDQDAQHGGVYLPAGSIISGVLITGMDAPTHNAARSQPYPALIRVKNDAILPNRYRLDVRECFIIASGYGSLSAERAYLRAEVLSCVRQDGGVIEVGLEAYAAGEDGKVGLRGRVVSKQGQLLAKSLAAGFFSGMSQVFNKAPVPTITTTSSGEVQYQDVLSSDSITAGAVKGASSALDRLAQYYLDMAKDIFPVIEINANRRIDFVVTRGASLQIVGAGDSASPATTSKGKKDS